MIMIAGFILIVISGVMMFVFLRNSKRPRMEMRIESIKFYHIKQDKKQHGPVQPHAQVKYNYDGTNYQSDVFLKVRGKLEGDWIEVTINPNQPTDLTVYAPKKEKRTIAVIFFIGAFLVAGSWWIIDYLDAW